MRRTTHAAVFTLSTLALVGCSSAPDFEPCPITQDEAIAILGVTMSEPITSDVTERKTYGDIARYECRFNIGDLESGLSAMSFESIDAEEGESVRDQFFDTAGALDQTGVRQVQPEWGPNAFIQIDGSSIIATFERDGRFWRFDALGGDTSTLESSVLELVTTAALPFGRQ